MPRILFLSPLPSWRRTTSSRRRRFFLRVVGELGFHYIAVERALLVEQGRRGRAEAVRAVVAAGASIAAHDPQRLVQCVVGHWHAIVIGRPADRGSSSLDQRFRRRSRAKRNRVDPRSRPARGKCLARHKILPRPRDIMLGRSRREFESKPGSIPVGAIGEPGTAWARLLPWSLLFYFCQLLPRVTLLVFLLVSAAIDDEN